LGRVKARKSLAGVKARDRGASYNSCLRRRTSAGGKGTAFRDLWRPLPRGPLLTAMRPHFWQARFLPLAEGASTPPLQKGHGLPNSSTALSAIGVHRQGVRVDHSLSGGRRQGASRRVILRSGVTASLGRVRARESLPCGKGRDGGPSCGLVRSLNFPRPPFPEPEIGVLRGRFRVRCPNSGKRTVTRHLNRVERLVRRL